MPDPVPLACALAATVINWLRVWTVAVPFDHQFGLQLAFHFKYLQVNPEWWRCSMAENGEVMWKISEWDRPPPQWPTNRHTPEFWEHLGRAIASFGFLEHALRSAIFKFTGAKPAPPEEKEAKKAMAEWGKRLERNMTAPLWNLAKEFEDAANSNPNNSTDSIGELVAEIKKAVDVRNTLCHGSWMVPDNEGKSLPLFTRKDHKTGQWVSFGSKVDIEFLSQVQAHVAELISLVIESVVHMGYQFPGGGGPGTPIYTRP